MWNTPEGSNRIPKTQINRMVSAISDKYNSVQLSVNTHNA